MISTLMPRFGVLSLFCLLAACQTFEDGDKRLYEQSNRLFEESLEQSQPKVAPPAAVQAGLIPPLQTFSGSAASSPRFDVAVSDMSASEFFLSLADSAGQNLVVHPDVIGFVTFSLRNVTLEETLAAVRDSYGYDYRRTAYGYQILPNHKYVRTYSLNYLDVQREGTAETRVSSGQMVSSENDVITGASSTTSRTSGTVNASRVTTSSKAEVWGAALDSIAMIIGVGKKVFDPDDFKIKEVKTELRGNEAKTNVVYKGSCRRDDVGSSVCYSAMSGVLIVKATAEDHARVKEFLKLVERNLQRQVILETKILEVTLSDGFQAGINWTQLGSMGNAEITLGQQGDLLSGPNNIGGVFSAAVQVGDFTGMLQLLETQGDVRVLSSPRISTLNNQKAVIKVGTDEFFVTDVSTTTTSLAGGNTAPDLDITLTPFFSGISLDVTPQIDENDQVTLHVRPTVSRVQDQNKIIQMGSEDRIFNLPLALSTTRQSDSIVRARSGQVVVIGGLLENTNTNTDANIPWASKLPIVGNLFQQQRKSLQQTELVILMRPQVVNDQVWLDELRKSAESFRSTR